ncbi:MAG: S-adenosylmethionine decarboxylase proenzyme [Oscillatoriales cyanobacterium CG2_30_40_61]|nr:MAG: S-adenosylmethionine decarboxylase proenzyme [Oscillatoriales cyanobacterium CG2_30_40_61]
MKQLGTHLVVDAWQCPAELLNDPERIRRAMLDAISAGGATLIDLCVHQFSPHGVTATATLAESHIAIHTWPELGYFAADLFFCGAGNPQRAIKFIETALQAKQVRLREFKRGYEPDETEIPDSISEESLATLVETGTRG